MKSFAILNTNVGLTTNVKLVVGTTYSLYMDSINSTPELNISKLKKKQFNKSNYWDELLSYFWKNIPTTTAFHVKYDNDNNIMFSDFENQYDDLYQSGARDIIDNRDYYENYEYFAPLYIYKNAIPSNFIIFRVDGAGLVDLNKDNFRSEIINKLKCVKNIDLSNKTPFGEWINTNFTNNTSFPSSPLYMDFRNLEFSSWYGINYTGGGYSEIPVMLDSTLINENTYSEFEKLIYDGYKNNNLIFPNILNISFLFDDIPATPSGLRKWSINRYMGFYMDSLQLEGYITPCELIKVKSDVVIDENNILYSLKDNYPFVDENKSLTYPYIEINGLFYKIIKIVENQKGSIFKIKTSHNTFEDKFNEATVVKYKIISNTSLVGLENLINKNSIKIDSTNKLLYYNGDDYLMDNYDNADVWLIEIGGVYHNLIKKNDAIYINSDYGFTQSISNFSYYVNDPDPSYRTNIDLSINSDKGPYQFAIYKCVFSDIKDFDTSITDTNFSKFEYEKYDQITDTDETKLYVTDYESNTTPKDFEEYKINGSVVNIPAASEYIASGELFSLNNNDLNLLWRKNPIRVKWGFQNSISSNDFPYLLNNSFISEDFNRTTNIFDPRPNRHERNLDYFYTINASLPSYTHHTLHVGDYDGDGNINTEFNFELDKYLGIGNYNDDYFTYFFGKKSKFNYNNIIKNTSKWSYFNSGDAITPNITLFRGIKFKIYDVVSVQMTDSSIINNINVKNTNTYDNYKFSILLSQNNYTVNSTTTNLNIATVSPSTNTLLWKIIDEWKYDKAYNVDDYVLWQDLIFISNTYSQIINPAINPINSGEWDLYTQSSIFWNPTLNGSSPTASNNMYYGFATTSYPPLVYNYGDYYFSTTQNGNNFWNPLTSYDYNDVVLFKNKIWISATSSNTTIPSINNYWLIDDTGLYNTIWRVVELWSENKTYATYNTLWTIGAGHYVIYDNIVWVWTSSNVLIPTVGIIPPNDAAWTKLYSLDKNTDYVYGITMKYNNIIQMNNRYYICVQNINNNSLENGINIYINKKYKNILINIYINDNTYSNVSKDIPGTYSVVYNPLSNADRDDLYSDIYSKITANNFTNAINDVSNKYDFSDNIRYVVINTDDTLNIYDFNNLNSVSNLPCFITCEGPDELKCKIKSNVVYPVKLSNSLLKPKCILTSGNITSIQELNYFSGSIIATEINKIIMESTIVPNYHGLKNNIYNSIYRYSGYYAPIFDTIELFKTPSLTQSSANVLFDTDLTNFGMSSEKIFSKVNRSKNILKLRNDPSLKSIYPMVDEYGYFVSRTFIFKSSWDFTYFTECNNLPVIATSIINKSLIFGRIFNNSNTGNLKQL